MTRAVDGAALNDALRSQLAKASEAGRLIPAWAKRRMPAIEQDQRNATVEPASDGEPDRFVTSLGCTIMVVPAPEHLGDGVLMTLRMEQQDDGRWCEVYLDREDLRTLRAMLDEGKVDGRVRS